MFKGYRWAWGVGALFIALALLLALGKKVPSRAEPSPFKQGDPADSKTGIVADQNEPAVVAFLGDLARGGQLQPEGAPFVIGDIIKLEAETRNAIEFRWTCNGVVLPDECREWSPRASREYTVTRAEALKFALCVRGAGAAGTSAPREKTLTPKTLVIEDFKRAPNVTEEDRALTGSEYMLMVEMQEPLTGDLEYYRYRYLVNEEPVKNEAGEEWTTEDSLNYTFPAPGQYSFRVEVRRATEKQAEASKDLAGIVKVADAVLLSFDALPEKYAPLGAEVDLDAFPTSLLGTSECRIGVKKFTAADFKWLTGADGQVWGSSERSWLPLEAGNYLLRVEVRQSDQKEADDFRELLYTVTEGEF